MCNALNSMPERGTRREDLRPGLRVTGFEHRVLIAFQVRPESVAILRLLYGGRSVELAFSQDDE
jgi:toxin ParE1/3/4